MQEMKAPSDVDVVDRRIAELEQIIRKSGAELAGLRVQRAWLLQTQFTGGLAGMERTQAILEVLRAAGHPLRPKEIVNALVAAGRLDDDRTVGATLNHLKKQGHVKAPSRGQWVAVGEDDSRE